MRLVNAGHDYAIIEERWTLRMVLEANDAMDFQEYVNRKAQARAKSKKGG